MARAESGQLDGASPGLNGVIVHAWPSSYVYTSDKS